MGANIGDYVGANIGAKLLSSISGFATRTGNKRDIIRDLTSTMYTQPMQIMVAQLNSCTMQYLRLATLAPVFTSTTSSLYYRKIYLYNI